MNKPKKKQTPKKTLRLIMTFLAALQLGRLTAWWTIHAAEATALPERKAKSAAKKTAEKMRPVVLDLNEAKWCLSFDEKGSPAICVKDSVYGILALCASGERWLIKSVFATAHFNRIFADIDPEYLFGLVEQIDPVATYKEIEPEWPSNTSKDISEHPSHDERRRDVHRSDAEFNLVAMPRKDLLNLRKHLQITGNGTGKQGVVSTKTAIESILLFMDERGDYAWSF